MELGSSNRKVLYLKTAAAAWYTAGVLYADCRPLRDVGAKGADIPPHQKPAHNFDSPTT